MSILTKPYMQTGNAHLLPIDRNDPTLALYLPLWYPHGDMTGSTIYSYDTNRHSCTVTGATWGSQGRSFDVAADDDINCGSAIALDNISLLTVELWIYNDSLPGLGCRIWYKYRKDLQVLAGGEVRYQQGFHVNGGGNYPHWSTAAGTIATGSWYHVVLTYDDRATTNDPIIYVNCLSKSLTESAAPVGTRLTDDSYDLYIGNSENANRGVHGKIGEVRTYSRILTPLEIQHNYNATKWRYS